MLVGPAALDSYWVRQEIEDLRIGTFGELIAEVTTTLAQLPDPETDLKCEPEA